MEKDQYVVALDLGVSQIRASLFYMHEDKLLLKATEMNDHEAVVRGRVVNKGKLTRTIERLIKDLFDNPDDNIPINKNNVDVHYCVGVSGMSFKTKSIVKEGNLGGQTFTSVELKKYTEQVLEEYKDSENGFKLVRAVPVKYETEAIDTRVVLPKELYSAPFDYSLNKVKITYLLTYVLLDYIDEIKKVLNKENVTFYPIASAKAKYLCSESNIKRSDGYVLIDMGGGSTSVAVYKSGSLLGEFSYPFGVNLITYDLVSFLNIDEDDAQNVKFNMPEIMSHNNYALYVDGRNLNVNLDRLKEVVQLRLEEILAHACAFFTKTYGKNNASHVLCGITGGGACTISVADIVIRMTDADVDLLMGTQRTEFDTGKVIIDTMMPSETQFNAAGVYGMMMLYREEFANLFVVKEKGIFDEELLNNEDKVDKTNVQSKPKKLVKSFVQKCNDFLKPSNDLGEEF